MLLPGDMRGLHVTELSVDIFIKRILESHVAHISGKQLAAPFVKASPSFKLNDIIYSPAFPVLHCLPHIEGIFFHPAVTRMRTTETGAKEDSFYH